ncbi:MAG: ferredoxin-type protein NapF [Pseudomonadota bacterium]|nr:MAG: ferredoxin-type protein NapF [Pseudomonadota bacterium]
MEAASDGSPVSRRQFLLGDVGGTRILTRPPWAAPETRFAEQCTRCGACSGACPEHIITVGRDGYPQIDFRRGECTLCAACVEVCEPGALAPAAVPWTLYACIGDTCLALRGVVCRSCAEQCETAAIVMRLVTGGLAVPAVRRDACTGCGACFRVCPVSAVTMNV